MPKVLVQKLSESFLIYFLSLRNAVDFYCNVSCCVFRNCYNDCSIIANINVSDINIYRSIMFGWFFLCNCNCSFFCCAVVIVITGINHINIISSRSYIIQIDYCSAVCYICSVVLTFQTDSHITSGIRANNHHNSTVA